VNQEAVRLASYLGSGAPERGSAGGERGKSGGGEARALRERRISKILQILAWSWPAKKNKNKKKKAL
jgi:hypothetical protein